MTSYIENTLPLTAKKTSHSRYFTVIFKSATHIPSQGGISAVLRRSNTDQRGYITNFKLHYCKVNVSMTIVSSTGAVASVIKTRLLCASAQNPIFLLCCNWENSQSVPVIHARQVVKGPTGLLKITETVQLLSPPPSLSPQNTDRLTPLNWSRSLDFLLMHGDNLQDSNYKLQFYLKVLLLL